MVLSITNLELIERHTEHRFAVVFNGMARLVSTGEEIPVEHLAWRKVPKNGMYRLSPAVCSGENCAVGTPNPKCVKEGTYSVNKCAVWYLENDISTTRVTLEETMAMVQDTQDTAMVEMGKVLRYHNIGPFSTKEES